EGGEYLLRAEGKDRFGNPVSGQTELFISGDDDKIILRLFAETEEFTVGEEPEVTLFSRASEGLGLLTYEGESILSYQIIEIAKENNRLPLLIGSEHAPNFTLAVAQMEGNRFHQVQKEFSVLQHLNIQLEALNATDSTKPEFFKPGERVKLEIRTSDQNGKPVSAEISLAMVDEALYAQYAERIPPIRDFFYDRRREFAAETVSSCTFSFEAQTKEIVSAILDEELRLEEEKMEPLQSKELLFGNDSAAPIKSRGGILGRITTSMGSDSSTEEIVHFVKPSSGEADFDGGAVFLQALREYFPETGYWNPTIVTDEDGKASVEFTLPDSTTKWRFSSRGISRETLVGESTAGILTKLPFFAEIKTPAVLTEGDRVSLLASLHNYSGSRQDALLSFHGSLDSTLLEEQEQRVGVENQQVSQISYRLDLSEIPETPASKSVTLELAADADLFQDRIKREVPLRPWGIEYVTRQSGTLTDDRKVEIELPQERPYLFQDLRILLEPALDRTLVELADDRPWPFKAPASSAIHEALVVLNAIRSFEYSGNAAAISDESAFIALQQRLKSLLTEVALRQKRDGSWNWTGTEARSDLFVSADAVILLSKARHQGYEIQKQALERGVRFLRQAFQSARDNEIKSYLLYALAVTNDLDFAHVNRVYRERNSLSSSGLAYLSLIYSRLKRPEIAAELNALLLQRAKVERDPVSDSMQRFWVSKSSYPWLQREIDLTSLVLSALQQGGASSEQLSGVVNWLYTQRRWLGWGSMRSNAGVSEALWHYYSHTQFAENRYTLKITVNGKALATIEANQAQGAIALDVPAEFLKGSGNTIDFDFEGRGSANYVCLLQGLSRDVRQSKEHYTLTRYYEPAPLVFQGKEIPRGFSILTGSYSTWRNAVRQIPPGGFGRVTLEYTRRHYDREQSGKNNRLILEEPIPAGCSVLEQSLTGGFVDYEIKDGKILFYLNNARYGTISYDLYGYLPGEYKILPTKIQAPYFPERRDYGKPYALTVLKRGEEPDEEYKKTPDELYYYGKALFDAKRYAEAGDMLRQLFKEYRLEEEPYRESAKMLMYIAIAENHSRDIVQYFEVLKEKYPNLLLSFEDVLRVGRAYRDIQEYERAVQVFKATAEASFLKDIQVSGSLEAQGEFFASLDYTKNLLLEYPDIPSTETSFYALAQLLSTEAARSKEDRRARVAGVAWKSLQVRSIAMLQEFLTRYPENPIADEVAFSLANAYIELEEFDMVVSLARDFQRRYPKSSYLSAYEYIEAYGNFELEQYERSLDLCRKIATGKYPDKQGKMRESDHKDLAIYIMGQIYHSMGQPEKAIAEYEKVKERFPDAKEVIEYFRRKALNLDEVGRFRPDEEARITLRYRNVKDANILVYRVDLMKLYLLRKNLNDISQINLAGISPYHQERIRLGDGKDYAEQEHELLLPLQEEGAYLLVAKESELDSSGMVLLSRLKMEVEEDVVSGRVRVNVKNAENGRYENNVHVKVIGSRDMEFVSGSTDLRGIFVADNIHGAATVIARKGDRYAFYRGSAVLQPPEMQVQRPMLQAPADMRSQAMQQLRATNEAIQLKNEGYLRQNLYQNTQLGVEVQATY
ncbi:MAG: tetratricopeptide repeat protein, partial [bacterium]|nr:tetratricopeptide repeat protein [bacterium]